MTYHPDTRQDGLRPRSVPARQDTETSARLTVFYDGSCPLCRREIAFYRRRRGGHGINWCDLGTMETEEVTPGLTRADAMKRFHARLPDGTLVAGGDAFRAIWRRLPLFRPAAVLFDIPGMRWALDRSYEAFLRFRPALQRAAAGAPESERDLLPDWLTRELRSDHAGETGAVWVYRGVLSITRDRTLRAFATRHMRTELGHQRALESVLPPHRRSVLLPLWRVAGWLTGALPALFGPRPVHATIDVVESFVDTHYQAQIDALDRLGDHRQLRNMLERCRLDEVEHRDEARRLHADASGWIVRAWCGAVARGSRCAAFLARRM